MLVIINVVVVRVAALYNAFVHVVTVVYVCVASYNIITYLNLRRTRTYVRAGSNYYVVENLLLQVHVHVRTHTCTVACCCLCSFAQDNDVTVVVTTVKQGIQ